jgi:Cdc6-like AAA superfamily ATPase
MIQNHLAFAPEELPRAVVGRNAEQNRLATALQPAVDGGRPEPALLSGPSGAGKTTVARATVRDLRQQAPEVSTSRVHCSGETRYRVAKKLVDAVGLAQPGRVRSAGELLDRLRDLDGVHVAILDEASGLQEPDVLAALLDVRGLAPVVIANDPTRLLADVDERTASRLDSAADVRFRPYTDGELVDILRDRADWGLVDGAVTDDRLEQIARAADGDARRAIAILRSAATIATDEGLREIPEDLVREEAVAAAAENLRDTQLEKLSEHHRAVYDVVETAESINRSTLYERYRTRVDEPRSLRTVQKYITDLLEYDLVATRGPRQDREYVLAAELREETV